MIDYENTNKEHLHDRIAEFIIQGKIINNQIETMIHIVLMKV